jgi:hypothetical protein
MFSMQRAGKIMKAWKISDSEIIMTESKSTTSENNVFIKQLDNFIALNY